jgi:hypothetical protein
MMFSFQSGKLGHSTNTIILKSNEHKSYAWVFGVSEIPLSFNGIDKVAVAVQRQSVIHTENGRFAFPTLGQHISTFRGYRILFSIRNPYINRFTNHFSRKANLPFSVCITL